MSSTGENGVGPSFTRIVHWLTGAYPDGLPADDRPALVGLLAPRLTPERIHQALVLLTPALVDPEAPRLLTREDVDELLAQQAETPAPVHEQRRVAGRLARAGWPLLGDVGG